MTSASDNHARAIRLWLWAVAVLVIALVLVGGSTRLTESGLSIVEWRPVTGVLPPGSDAGWQAEFQKYQAIPQYTQRNAGMDLAAFKTIYWWEWTHRLLGRGSAQRSCCRSCSSCGVAGSRPVCAGACGGSSSDWAPCRAQSAGGWSPGLADRTEVSQYRSPRTCCSRASSWWRWCDAQQPLRRGPRPCPAASAQLAIALVALILLQIYLGGIVAGLRAGLIYNTWPLIDGRLVPEASRLWFETPLWRNLFENTLTAQFDHRMVAYALLGLALWHAIDAAAKRAGARSAIVLAAAVSAQALLGVLTLINQAPIALALLHQAAAIGALTIAVVHAAGLTSVRRTSVAAVGSGSVQPVG
jgi:cytochrome c oxidase assembly protein subunit 15